MLDEWQAWCLDQMLAEDEYARWAASIILIVMPRQNGKNAVLEALELYAFYVLGEHRILHTAHLAKTAADHMRRMVQLVRANPELDAITQIYWANGKEALVRSDTEARLEFITRGKGTSRGGSPTRVVFDEALFLSDDQVNAILPSLSAQSMNADPPQIIYTSSAPLPESEVLHRVRSAAMAGSLQGFYAEWSIPDAIDLTDDDLLSAALLQANPGMGIRISEDWVRRHEMVQMSAEGFLTERLGVVFSDGRNTVVPPLVWAKCGDGTKAEGRVLAWDVSPDRSYGSVGWVGRRDDGGFHGEIVESKPGADWIPGRLVQYALGAGALVLGVATDPGAPGGSLLPDVEAAFKAAKLRWDSGAGGNVVKVSGMAYAAACGDWYDKVLAGLYHHVNQDWLNRAVTGAVWRRSGESRVFDRRNSGDQITPLCLQAVALRGLLTLPTGVQPSKYNDERGLVVIG